MLKRCYDQKTQLRKPTYVGCTVCDDWLYISKFKDWLVQDKEWFLKDIDKDLLVKGNKIYSPDTCVLVSKKINQFIVESVSRRGKLPVGVSTVRSGKFLAQCGNPFAKCQDALGLFETAEEAHAAWRKRKHEFACQLADLQSDPRVANALRTRYL